MKKLFCILLTMALLVTHAAADVIWEPYDRFYEEHRSECVSVHRSYYVGGDKSLPAYEKPGGRKSTDFAPGAVLMVTHKWTAEDGEVWGLAGYNDSSWVPMDERLVLIYDAQSFREEHSGEFREYDGSFEELCTSEDLPVVFWSFPCSGSTITTLEHLEQSYSALMPGATWTDPEGRIWGEIGYYMGLRGWVCLSDPANEEIPAADYVTTIPETQTSDPGEPDGPEQEISVAAAGAAAGSVAGVSLVLLALFRYLKKKR